MPNAPSPASGPGGSGLGVSPWPSPCPPRSWQRVPQDAPSGPPGVEQRLGQALPPPEAAFCCHPSCLAPLGTQPPWSCPGVHRQGGYREGTLQGEEPELGTGAAGGRSSATKNEAFLLFLRRGSSSIPAPKRGEVGDSMTQSQPLQKAKPFNRFLFWTLLIPFI